MLTVDWNWPGMLIPLAVIAILAIGASGWRRN